MKFSWIIIGIFFNVFHAESRMVPMNVEKTYDSTEEPLPLPIDDSDSGSAMAEKVIGLRRFEAVDPEEPFYDADRKIYTSDSKKPCAIVVMSNIQNANMQSLLRKYRYDANGILIPSSVQYFIKLPQGLRSSPLLVPLTDKAFSPLGGFVRYYKEVPPIPQYWKR